MLAASAHSLDGRTGGLPYVHPLSPCMEKLEGLGWTAGFAFESFGMRIGVRVNDPSLLDELRRRVPPRARPIAPGKVHLLYSLLAATPSRHGNVRRYHLMYADNGRLARTFELPAALDAMKDHVQMWVAELATRWLFVHAGVVGWKGRAIVLPGRSESGKSTLVEALVRAGATYYSDEYAPIDREGRVHAYPRAIVLRDEGAKRRELPVPDERTGKRALPIGLVAFTKYGQGASLRLRALPPGRAALRLLSNTVSVRHQPARTMLILRRCVESARLVGGARGEADAAAETLLRTLESTNASESAS